MDHSEMALIASRSADIINLIRKVMKDMKVEDVGQANDSHGRLSLLEKNPGAVLLLDWGLGADEVLNVLESVQAVHPAGTRPVFLFSRNEDDMTILQGLALEYKVMQVHAGPISRDLMRDRIEKLFTTQVFNKEISNGLAAVVLARQGNNIQSEKKLLINLYNRYPDDEFLAAEVADFYWRHDHVDEALRTLEPFMHEGQKNPRILNIHGRALLKKGMFEEATISLQQADLINPLNIKRLISLGEAYLQLDNANRARASFNRALELDPDNKGAQKGMGTSLLLLGDINEALVFIRQISDPAEMASVFNAAAVIAIRGNRHQEGMQLYRTATKTLPHHDRLVLAKLAFNMGLANYRIDELVWACYYFEIAHRMEKTYTKARQAFAVLKQKVVAEDRKKVGDDLIAALLAEEQDLDELADEDIELKGEAAEYDMDF